MLKEKKIQKSNFPKKFFRDYKTPSFVQFIFFVKCTPLVLVTKALLNKPSLYRSCDRTINSYSFPGSRCSIVDSYFKLDLT